MTSMTACLERRRRLGDAMLRQAGGPALALVPTAPEALRNRDSHYPYRYDSTFHYLTAFSEPEAVLVQIAGPAPRSILFCRPKNLEREIWDGFRFGPEAAREAFGVDEAYSIEELDERILPLLGEAGTVFYPLGASAGWDARVVGWLNRLREAARSGQAAPARLADVRTITDEMRLLKDAGEIALMQRAADISAAAHLAAMRATCPGGTEYEIDALLSYEFRRQGAQAAAYTSIVAGGANACVLHYVNNDAPLKEGELLLIDAGCELDGYAADITRTFPVNGRFSGPQKEIYDLVLAAQEAAIAAVTVGQGWNASHEAALSVLVDGFISLGLCRGSRDAVLESGDYRRFYMHRTGHWLGKDVHDVGEYKRNGDWRPLEAGMVLTVEPGCYVRPDPAVPAHFWNIGVRIEDDVLVTEAGPRILTDKVPKSAAAIEAVMGK